MPSFIDAILWWNDPACARNLIQIARQSIRIDPNRGVIQRLIIHIAPATHIKDEEGVEDVRDLDEMLSLMAEERAGRSLLDDATFRHRIAGIGAPSIEEETYTRLLLTALVAAVIGMSSQLVSEINKPLPDLIDPHGLILVEREI